MLSMFLMVFARFGSRLSVRAQLGIVNHEIQQARLRPKTGRFDFAIVECPFKCQSHFGLLLGRGHCFQLCSFNFAKSAATS